MTSALTAHLNQSKTDVAGFPSSNWESQAQPVGNGCIGAMIFGNPLKERIQFNDIHTTTWKQDNTTFTREVFASKPDDAIIIRIQADQPEKIITVKEKDGRTARISADREGHFRFPTKAGKTYQINL